MYPRISSWIRRLAMLLMAAASLSTLPLSAQVYSINAVGCVQMTFYPGANLFANPLNLPENTVGAILTGVPDGTILRKLVNGNYVVNTYYSSIGWSDPAMLLSPGEGALLFLPGSASLTVTLVGEVNQGYLTIDVPAGVSLLSSRVPQAGRLQTDLLYPPLDGDSVYLLNAATQTYSRYNYSRRGGWTHSEPVLSVAQGFILSNHIAASSWQRSFSVVPGGSPGTDIGLRVFDGADTLTIQCETPGAGGALASPLRIAKQGTVYGILLVDTDSPLATPIRVNTASGPKAWAKWGGANFISIRRNGNGTVILEWTGGGTLQAAIDVLGSWTDLAGATSPYTFVPALPVSFYRIRQ